MRLRAAFFLAFIALGLFVFGPVRDGITLGSDPAAYAGVRASIGDDIQVYLDAALTQEAATIAFGTVQVEASGSQPSPVSVPVWVKNVSTDFILLTLDDDFGQADVVFQGQSDPPLLAPGQVFPGMLGLDFSTPQDGDAPEAGNSPQGGSFNFTIFFQSEEPPPNMPPVINLAIGCGGLTARVSGSVTDPNSDLAQVAIDWDNAGPTVITSGFGAIDESHTYSFAGGERKIEITAMDARGATTTLEESLRPGIGDSDCDGLTDGVETTGWTVNVDLNGDGNKNDPGETYHVDSDPFDRDTDDDGVSDFSELGFSTDPRKPDTDLDLLNDFEELFIYQSSPTSKDTDGDSRGNPLLFDGAEILFPPHTSPTLADTDGDGFDDFEEIIELGIQFNPLIADVPTAELSLVGTADVRLDVEYSDAIGTTESHTAGLQNTQAVGFSKSDSRTTQVSVEATLEITASAEVKAGFPPSAKVSKSITASVTAGYMSTNTTAFSSESKQEAQQSYQDFQEQSRNRTETTSSGTIKMGLQVQNTGDVTFTLQNLVVTALQRDPDNRSAFKALASLTLPIEDITLGPGSATGTLLVQQGDLSASLVKELLQYPSGLFFKVGNLALVDEHGLNFEFRKQVTNARTALVVIDFGLNGVERYRVATNVRRDPTTGVIAGVTMREVMADMLQLDYATEEAVVDSTPLGYKVLTRVKTSAADVVDRTFWVLIGSDPRHVADIDFDDIVLKSGEEIRLAYFTDMDRDGLPAREEYLYGSSDELEDTDGDGINDFDEVRTGWVVDTPALPAPIQVYSDPSRIDVDGDTLTDDQEMAMGTDPNNPDTDGDGLRDDVDAKPLDPFNAPPIINLSASVVGVVATVSGSVTDSIDAIAEVLIDWDDAGATTTVTSGFGSISAPHGYAAPGDYTIKATATDVRGAIAEKLLTVTIECCPLADLFAYYRFANDNINTGGRATDSSGNNNHGTFEQVDGLEQAQDRFGSFNSAVMFWGSFCCDRFGFIAGVPGFSETGSTDVTLAAWVNGSFGGIGPSRNWIVGEYKWVRLQMDEGKLELWVPGPGTGLDYTIVQDSTRLPQNQWVFVAGVLEGNIVKLYVDGVLKKTQTLTHTPNNASACGQTFVGGGPTVIGCGSPSSWGIQGIIDDIRIYQRALSGSEVTSLYHEGGWPP